MHARELSESAARASSEGASNTGVVGLMVVQGKGILSDRLLNSRRERNGKGGENAPRPPDDKQKKNNIESLDTTTDPRAGMPENKTLL
jgi:hypothetical protein